ncbi:HNH endonuclease family protein [Streptomyces sp. NPDC087437]|uniref:HNH endonuclease family protein n=1 Tax=Streptomyces sp. NPDC087437 TaxID=3365789 RepID=UPI0038005F26
MLTQRRAAVLPALTLLVLAATGCATIDQAIPDGDAKPPASAAPSAGQAVTSDGMNYVPLAEAIARLTVVPEHVGGYNRHAFKHWNAGLIPDDGCNTRAEVLIAEAVKPPTIGEGCKLTGGEWLSYYDNVTVNDPAKLDIDHMVPLEEAWSSGAYAWSPGRREAYANDLAETRSLVAVTAKTNRSKGKRDPAEWLPPAPGALCTYLEDWTTVKLRWSLTADQAEHDTLVRLARDCPDSTVTYELAP